MPFDSLTAARPHPTHVTMTVRGVCFIDCQRAPAQAPDGDP
jgi:hypothetical protein